MDCGLYSTGVNTAGLNWAYAKSTDNVITNVQMINFSIFI